LNARQQRQQSQERETSITANEVQLESYKRVTLNAQNAISDTLEEAFLDLSTAIKNFLSADDLTKSLTAGITVLNANFVTFFNEIRTYATDMLKNLADVAQSSFTFYNKLVGLLDA
jgi:ABC-type transporter Mla subunit MlaD